MPYSVTLCHAALPHCLHAIPTPSYQPTLFHAIPSYLFHAIYSLSSHPPLLCHIHARRLQNVNGEHSGTLAFLVLCILLGVSGCLHVTVACRGDRLWSMFIYNYTDKLYRLMILKSRGCEKRKVLRFILTTIRAVCK